jgi:predicted amidohydrolase YtcJ
LLIKQVRLVSVTTPAPDCPVDVRVRAGQVQAVRPGLLPERGERVLHAEGRWLIPGLWDAHVHMQQWARTIRRLDLSDVRSPGEVVVRVAEAARRMDDAGAPEQLIAGQGYRSGGWERPPTVAELDAVSGGHPVALISADVHNGWLNSRALAQLQLPDRVAALEEAEWFAVMSRLGELEQEQDEVGLLREASARAARLGVVGIGDMEMEPGYRRWPERVDDGVDLLRVRTAVYPDRLGEVISAGHRTGDPLDRRGLVEMGPLKAIFDGSVNTRTAYCCDPYPAPDRAGEWRGVLNFDSEELAGVCLTAASSGLDLALHAIGDAAVALALDVFERTGASGSIEHAQIVRVEDAPRFSALGVRASVQPAHLLDDRDLSSALWPGLQDRCFPLRSLIDAGTDVRLGSDAPVAALDPWLAMAAAVHRSADARPSWTAAEQVTAREALAASTDGAGTVGEGAPGDLALLDNDPLADAGDGSSAAALLRSTGVAATVLGGRITHGDRLLDG